MNNIKANLQNISRNGRYLLLAYDQGLEIGPTEFNDTNVDPEFIFKLADEGKFTGVIVQKGLAEKYYVGKNWATPLIVKLNGKDKIYQGEPISLQLCSVKEAVKLGASAVGYTIYLGSEHEPEMLQEFSKIEEEAHAAGLPVIGWMYPRGKAVTDPSDPDVTAYAARVGLELGADLVKVHYTGSVESFHWVVRSAGETGVLSSGGEFVGDSKTLQLARDIVASGAAGLAIGRNMWEAKDPLELSRKLRQIVLEDK